MEVYKKMSIQISLIIVAATTLIVVSLGLVFNQLSKKDVEIISETTAHLVYEQINKTIDAPVKISETMANDLFLHNFIESKSVNNESIKTIKNYLAMYQKNYQFDSIFFISAKTLNYYHYKNGLDRTLNKNNAEDKWFFDFIKSDKNYEINIDNDQAFNDNITVFANYKILSKDNELLGVIGVGSKVDKIQAYISNLEKENSLKIFIADNNGQIEISSDINEFDNKNVFELEELNEPKNRNIPLQNGLLYKNWTSKTTYLTHSYFSDVEWHLLVQKNTKMYLDELWLAFTMMIIISLIVIIVLNYFVYKLTLIHNKEMTSILQTDKMTKLKNRNVFNLQISLHEKKITEYKSFALGIVDINDLKHINDTFGHIEGDKAISSVAEIISDVFDKNAIFRTGGDEFTLIFVNKSKEEIDDGWKTALKKFDNYNAENKIPISVAFGYSFWNYSDTMTQLFNRADENMYQNKQTMKNNIKIKK